MRRHMGKPYSCQLTTHGGVATSKDTMKAWKEMDYIRTLADEIENAGARSSGRTKRKAAVLGTPRPAAGKEPKDPRSAIKLSDGGPGERAHDTEGPGHGLAAVATGLMPAAVVSPFEMVRNEIEHEARTRSAVRRMTRI